MKDEQEDKIIVKKMNLGGMIFLRRACVLLLLIFVFAAMPLSRGQDNLEKTGDLRENISTEIKKTYEGTNGYLSGNMPNDDPEKPEPCATPSFDAFLSLIGLFGTIIILNWRR